MGSEPVKKVDQTMKKVDQAKSELDADSARIKQEIENLEKQRLARQAEVDAIREKTQAATENL